MLYSGVVVLGFGGHARSVADVALSTGVEQLYFVDNQARHGESFVGFPAIKDVHEPLAPEWAVFPAAGDNARRRDQVLFCLERDFPVATLVANKASAGVCSSIGMGVFVGRNATIGAAAEIGVGSIINTAAVVDHESVVGDFSHISVNSSIAGRCRIGNFVFIGAGAVVIDGVSIVDNVTVGAGAVVVSDIDAPGVYVGIPARRIK